MNIIAVDDERIALEGLVSSIERVSPNYVVKGFRQADEALNFVRHELCQVAFLDIEMRDMNGIELAKKMKQENPSINIIFTTGFTDYTVDAFSLHASGYILKPVTTEKIMRELEDLRYPGQGQFQSNKVVVHTFGNFEVYVDGVPVKFRYSKTKELFAYLVDRCGALCTNREIMAVLWEDEIKGSYFRNIRADLLGAMPEEIFVKKRGEIGVAKEKLQCDYYAWMDGQSWAINGYNGEYMSQYSWGEKTLGQIKKI